MDVNVQVLWSLVLSLLPVTLKTSNLWTLPMWQQALLFLGSSLIFLVWISMCSLVQHYTRKTTECICKTCWPAFLLLFLEIGLVVYVSLHFFDEADWRSVVIEQFQAIDSEIKQRYS